METRDQVYQLRLTAAEKTQLFKSAEALEITTAELLRKGARFTALADPSLWEAVEFMSERINVPAWDILYLAVADLFAQFAAEETRFLNPTIARRVRKLYDQHRRGNRRQFLPQLLKEWEERFEATRASERNL